MTDRLEPKFVSVLKEGYNLSRLKRMRWPA